MIAVAFGHPRDEEEAERRAEERVSALLRVGKLGLVCCTATWLLTRPFHRNTIRETLGEYNAAQGRILPDVQAAEGRYRYLAG